MVTIHKMPTIGTEGLIKAVFGVAYTQDVDELSKKLENVESHLESDVKVVREGQSKLTSETRSQLEQQKSVMSKVEDMAHELELKVRLVSNNQTFS